MPVRAGGSTRTGAVCAGFEAMRQEAPDFFVFSGDTVYADGPLVPEVRCRTARCGATSSRRRSRKVAETLDEFRGQWRYNLLDENVRRFNAEVPGIVQWDDHEVTNNWYPGEILTTPAPTPATPRRRSTCSPPGDQAFHEYFPMTPHRPGPVHRVVSTGRCRRVRARHAHLPRRQHTRSGDRRSDTAILGDEQLAWLERSSALPRVWKVIAVRHAVRAGRPDGPVNIEAIANRDPGLPLGRELEVAELLRPPAPRRPQRRVGHH